MAACALLTDRLMEGILGILDWMDGGNAKFRMDILPSSTGLGLLTMRCRNGGAHRVAEESGMSMTSRTR